MSQHRRKTGSGKSDENVAEKVRLMKEKQKQWMQERESAKETCVSRPLSGNKQLKQVGKRPLNPVSSQSKANSLAWISKDDYHSVKRTGAAKMTTPRSEKLSTTGSRQDKSGYGSSRTIKDRETERSRGSKRSETSITGFDEGEQKSTRTAALNVSRGHNTVTGDSLENNFTSGSFNAIADEITERLQFQDKNRSENFVPVSVNKSNKPISNHVCSGCNTLMAPPQHSPIAIIPCGHTFCQVCVSDYSKCPQCQSEVFSTAPNTVMEHIIADFAKKQEKERLEQLEEQTRKYVEEYQNLNLRCEGLADEADRILNYMESITEGIIEEKRTGRKLEKENVDIKDKIKELELQFQQNEELVKESSSNCYSLEQNYNDEKEKLTLIEETIKTIRNSKERAKIMIQNLAPNLKLNDSF